MAIKTINYKIADILKLINVDNEQDNGIFLPYIQRDFVWNEERIYSLLDSLMLGYPMGTILIWRTDRPVNYRWFEENYEPKTLAYDFFVDDYNNKISRQYVLDGQQRLQSLYIAMNGTYNGNVLFMNLLSGTGGADDNYEFAFLNPASAEGNGWIKVPDFLAHDFKTVNMLSEIKKALKNKGIIPAICTYEEANYIVANALKLYKAFKTDKNMPVQILTNDIPLKDIAAIFTRINSGGIVLDATDLAMATIASEWTEANASFNELVKIIRDDMGFARPRDFILQSCAAVLRGIAGTGAAVTHTFSEIQEDLKNNFPAISVAILDVLNFIVRLRNSACNFNIPFYAPVIILVAYRYAHGRDAWDSKSETIKKFLFTAFLCSAFANPTQKLMKDLLAYVSKRQNSFLLNSIKKICKNNKRDFDLNIDDMLTSRIDSAKANLIMYLVYKDQQEYNPDTMTIRDHIFPRAVLRSLRHGSKQLYSPKQYDSILNCELLTSADNQAKGDKLPDNYFKGLNKLENYLQLHAIPEDEKLWNLNNYLKFLDARKKLMADRIKNNF